MIKPTESKEYLSRDFRFLVKLWKKPSVLFFLMLLFEGN